MNPQDAGLMIKDERHRVVTWLHLDDREEYGDTYLDGSPIAHTREVWHRVDIGPWCYGPESLSRSVPITEPDAASLLETPPGEVVNALYARLGVHDLKPMMGLPKGPYYDRVDVDYVLSELRRALALIGPREVEGKADRRGEARRMQAALTLESNLVAAIRHELGRDPDALEKMDPFDFERLVAELLRAMGYDVMLTPKAKDGGRDILAIATLPPGLRLLFTVECKRWRKHRPVEVGDVRQFIYTVRENDKANGGMIVTTSSFSAGARAEEQKWRWLLTLFDGDNIKEWISQYGHWSRSAEGGLWLPKSPA
jgi:hypothetical protein